MHVPSRRPENLVFFSLSPPSWANHATLYRSMAVVSPAKEVFGPLYRVSSIATEEVASKIRNSTLPWEVKLVLVFFFSLFCLRLGQGWGNRTRQGGRALQCPDGWLFISFTQTEQHVFFPLRPIAAPTLSATRSTSSSRSTTNTTSLCRTACWTAYGLCTVGLPDS